MVIYRTIVLAAAAVLLQASVHCVAAGQEADGAQTPAAQQRAQETRPGGAQASRATELERLGLAEDPGPDPDPKKEYVRFARRWTIQKIERGWTAPARNGREGWIQPNHHVTMDAEIYQANDEFVWVFIEVVPADRKRAKYRTDASGKKIKIRDYRPADIESFKLLREEFEPINPPKSKLMVKFEESSQGLPTKGSWRNSAAVADMNGDGNPDIVLPPQRMTSEDVGTILLGDGKGSWTVWETASWPRTWNYGSVSAGDLNADGIADLVFAAHLQGIVCMLSDGKGKFTDASEGLPRDFPTRRARLVDVDLDGDLDIVALTEGPTRMSLSGGVSWKDGSIRGYLNDGRAGKWLPFKISPSERPIAGDWLAAGDFNGDAKPDVVGSSIMQHGTDLVWLGDAKLGWTPLGRGLLPFYSMYQGLAVGKFSGGKSDEIVFAFTRDWPPDIDPDLVPYPQVSNVVGLELLSWKGAAVQRTPLMRRQGRGAIASLTAADFDGDGKLDLAYLEYDSASIVVLLGRGDGTFARADVVGLDLPPNRTYDLQSGDFDKDGRPDLLMLFEADENQSNGFVRVYLNRGLAETGT